MQSLPRGRIGPYRVQSQLGRGGGGVVYRAVHEETGAPVALKTVPAPSAGMVQGIRREIHALSRLQHPGVVRILAKGEHEGTPWYAMELIQGTTLLEHCRARPTPEGLRGTLSVIRRLCAPLAYLHGEGVVHGDLKPRNVLVRDDGMPVIVDFGLARRAGGESRRESLDLAGDSGTAAFMSPEQLRGELCDARADLFSMGCILYVLLTGRPPFATIGEIVDSDRPPERPSSLSPLPPELDALVLRLLKRQPRERIGHADDVAQALAVMGAEDGLASMGPRPRAFVYRPPMAGREGMAGAIVRFLSAGAGVSGGVLLVGGESGVGKTRFVLEAIQRVTGKVRVVASECRPPGEGGAKGAAGGEPLGPLRPVLQVVADLCREGNRAMTERLLAGRGKILAAYEPALAGLPSVRSAPSPPELPAHEARQRLFLSLHETLAGLAAQMPLLLVFDDLHWADDLTLSFLATAPARFAASHVHLVATHRTEETEGALANLVAHPEVRSLNLDRLEPGAVSSMIEEMLAAAPPSGFVDHLVRSSEGNPFFVTQYVHAAIEEGMLRRSGDGAWHVVDPSATDYERIPLPRALADLVGRRLDGLSANARAVLEAGAVLGRNVDGSLLPAVAAKQDDDILDAITELVARRVLEASPGGDLRFAHDKLREVAYGRLDGERRRAHHERAAHALSAHGSAVDDAILGHHFEQALIFDRARTCYIAAARAAVKAYAHVEAERLYRSALRLAAKPTVESITAANELGSTVLLLRGRTGEAEAIHGKAIQDSRDGDLPAMEARSQWLLGDVEAHLGRKQEALALYEQALATYRRLGDRRQEGYLQGNVGVIKKEQGRIHEALQLYGEALAIADEMGDRRQQARLLCNLANLHQEMGRADEGIAEFEKAATLARELGDRRLEGKVLGNLGVLHWDQGRVEASRALYEQALAIDRDVGDRRHEGMMLGNLATVSWVAGQLADAQRLYELGLAIAREVGNRRNEIVVLRNLAALSDEQGRREEARALHEQALAIAQATGDRRDEGIVLDNLAENARARGDPAASWELLQRALAIHAEVHNRRGEGQALGTIASLHHDAGRMEEARDSYERAIAIHGEVGDPRLEGIRMGHLARHLLFTTGDARKALDLAETGDRKLQGPHDIDRGHTLCVLGHAAIASGRSAAETLALLARLAESLTHGAASALDEPVEKLARAQCAFETGAPVVCGHALHDVTPGQLAWLRANRPEAIPSGVEKGHSSRP